MTSLLRFFVVLAWFATGAITACARAPTTAPDPAIWRLADEDSEIWLFGTVHVLPPDLKWRTERVDAAFDKADTVYFETQTDAAAQPAIVTMAQTYGNATDGKRLSARLTAADRKRYDRVCAQLKMNCAALEGLRPWYAANALSVALVIGQGQSVDSGVERILEKRASDQNKKRAYFETAEQQIRVLADLSPEAELQFFTATLRQIEEEHDMVAAIDRAWARGDTKALDDDLNSLLQEAGPDVYDALIRDRNRRWTNEIDKMMKGSGTVFVAVGAAHLVGKDGVPAMLRARGYAVEGP